MPAKAAFTSCNTISSLARSATTQVLIDKHDKAFAVKYEKHGKIRHAFAKKEIILSGGSIGTPMILMHSGIGPKQHLKEIGVIFFHLHFIINSVF
jgi:choline dehydrogenase-like flavoprotein